MKRLLIAAMFLLLTSCPLNVNAQTKKTISKEGLVNAVKIFFDAVKAADLEKVKSFYSTDYVFNGPNGRTGNAEGRLRALKAQAGSFVSATELDYRLLGDAAVVTGVATTTTATGANEQSRFMQVWTIQGSELRLVASQVTKIE